jgi:hypothetical protein
MLDIELAGVDDLAIWAYAAQNGSITPKTCWQRAEQPTAISWCSEVEQLHVTDSGEDGMSTQEIIRELAKLNRDELTQVDLRLHELLQEKIRPSGKSWGEALLEVAGTVEGLPPDYAENYDHYLHGLPRRWRLLVTRFISSLYSALVIDGTPALSRSIDNFRVCSSQQNGF